MPTSIQKLGVAPSPSEVDEWLLELGLSRSVVGKSVQGRNLVVYELNFSEIVHEPTVLFLSLSHGNEPMGLFSLLMSAQMLAKSRVRGRQQPARVVFFPMVNVDAYTINREQGYGCLRTNLHALNCTGKQTTTLNSHCLLLSSGKYTNGVDLNRNYPTKQTDGSSAKDEEESFVRHDILKCSYSFPGPYPFSEPETRAVRDVVESFNVTHAMSFHSMSASGRPRLLIHPFTSTRPFREMPLDRANIYREWSNIMNTGKLYETGTASETIGYTAAGSSIDWMEENKGIFAFVVEAVPPCGDRWCENRKTVLREARVNARTATLFVQLASYGRLIDDERKSLWRLGAVFISISLAYVLLWRRQHSLLFFLRRCKRKDKQVLETELCSLTTQ